MKKDLWTSSQQIHFQSFINYYGWECRMVLLPGRMISHFLINYVCVFHTTQRLHSQRNESICSHKYLCPNVYSTGIQEFSTLLSKSFASGNSKDPLYSSWKKVGGGEEEWLVSRKAAGSLLHPLLWLNLEVQEILENTLYLVHCNSKQRKDSFGKKGRIRNIQIKSRACHIHLSSRDDC